MDTRIYVMTHKRYVKPGDDLYRTLHVGRALGSDLGYEGDDTGDQISAKNKNYCELTGLYWLWKNVDCDIIGICHYRRYFAYGGDLLRQGTIEGLLEAGDIILPRDRCLEPSVRDHYKKIHHIQDLEVCRQVIAEKCPAYLPAFDLSIGGKLFSIGNMMVAKKPVFDAYCQWLFSILFEVEARVDLTGYDSFQTRLFGFLSERLLRVWILCQTYKVIEVDAVMQDPQDLINRSEVAALKKRAVNLALGQLIQEYAKGNYYDLVDNSPLDVDFQGRMPVWICCWQGLETATELTRLCVQSVRNQIPADKAEVILISYQNAGSYLTLPEWVVRKYNQGIIQDDQLTAIIEAGLLYRYGGLWLGSSYYLNEPLGDDLYEADFFTYRSNASHLDAGVTQGRWSADVIKIGKGSLLFRFVLNALYEYWHIMDSLVEPALMDYIIDEAMTRFAQVWDMVSACPYAQPHLQDLAPLLNRQYDADKLAALTKDTSLFRLDAGQTVQKSTMFGDETFYGHIYHKVFG